MNNKQTLHRTTTNIGLKICAFKNKSNEVNNEIEGLQSEAK